MGSCDNCTATHTLTNQGTNATSIANAIIAFYFDKNLKQSEQKARYKRVGSALLRVRPHF